MRARRKPCGESFRSEARFPVLIWIDDSRLGFTCQPKQESKPWVT
jgi:hypothetical protein